MEILRDKRSFDLDEFLKKPLFAHLSTSSPESESHRFGFYGKVHVFGL
ncbi:hypothetical protein [Halobacillus andaensis]